MVLLLCSRPFSYLPQVWRQSLQAAAVTTLSVSMAQTLLADILTAMFVFGISGDHRRKAPTRLSWTAGSLRYVYHQVSWSRPFKAYDVSTNHHVAYLWQNIALIMAAHLEHSQFLTYSQSLRCPPLCCLVSPFRSHFLQATMVLNMTKSCLQDMMFTSLHSSTHRSHRMCLCHPPRLWHFISHRMSVFVIFPICNISDPTECQSLSSSPSVTSQIPQNVSLCHPPNLWNLGSHRMSVFVILPICGISDPTECQSSSSSPICGISAILSVTSLHIFHCTYSVIYSTLCRWLFSPLCTMALVLAEAYLVLCCY